MNNITFRVIAFTGVDTEVNIQNEFVNFDIENVEFLTQSFPDSVVTSIKQQEAVLEEYIELYQILQVETAIDDDITDYQDYVAKKVATRKEFIQIGWIKEQ
jgi:hypothetical protein